VSDAQVVSVPGWFDRLDIAAFRFVLGEQARRGQRGDLAELGVFLGQSAVLVGSYQAAGETFTVVDLFEDVAPDAPSASENAAWYDGLSQARFEASYVDLHGDLPVVVRGPSRAIRDQAAPGRHRFVHVDASHVYDNVVEDVATARLLLAPDGVVVFDDYRSSHTPGVAAAVWPALRDGLVPFLATPAKLYATWDDAGGWPAAVLSWLPSSGFAWEIQQIAGLPVARAWSGSAGRAARWVPPALVPPTLRARNGLRRLRALRAR
jgi:hypothetical protein